MQPKSWPTAWSCPRPVSLPWVLWPGALLYLRVQEDPCDSGWLLGGEVGRKDTGKGQLLNFLHCVLLLPIQEISTQDVSSRSLFSQRAAVFYVVWGGFGATLFPYMYLVLFSPLGNNTCFYGKCYYCRETEPACADGDTMEGSVTLWLPDVWPLQKHRHPWGRTYREGKLAR